MADDGKPKKTPPPATIIRFPSYPEAGPSDLAIQEGIGIKELQSLFQLRKLLDIKSKHLAAINVQHQGSVPLEALVLPDSLPPKNWDNDPALSLSGQMSPTTETPSSETLSNGAAVPGHEAYYLRKKELEFDSKDVYHALSRAQPRPDRNVVKVVHYRKFWMALQQVGAYWDTSLDNAESEVLKPPEELGQMDGWVRLIFHEHT